MQFKGLVLLKLRSYAPKRSLSTKIALVMKLTTVLLLAMVLQVSAKTMAQTVTYTGKAVPLQQVLTAIREQTGYKFFYRNEDLEGAPVVTVQWKDEALQHALETMLAARQLEFSMEGKTIFISKKEVQKTTAAPAVAGDGQAVQGEASGVVRDTKGRPIPGVTVIVKGGRVITATDDHGFFMLRNLSAGDTLLFSSVSYEPTALPANLDGLMAVVMHERITALSIVTVSYNTGYQTLSKERATGSFGKPDMQAFHNRVGTNDIVGRLEGQVAGLSIGQPGDLASSYNGDGISTRKSLIRGTTTVVGNIPAEPLYVVNGVLVHDFATVNADDIQDITILKDAAAAAIWGARAANGVIVVITKSGHNNQPLSVNYSGSINLQGKPDFSYLPVLSSRQFIETAKEVFDPVAFNWNDVSTGFVSPHEKILYDQYRGVISAGQANASLDSLGRINNLGQIKDIWFRNAMTNNQTVSVSGGTNAYNFYGSLGWIGVQSNTPGSRNNSYRVSLSQNVHAGKRLSITLNTTLINSVSSADNEISVSNNFLPYQLFRDAAGNSINMPYMTGYGDSLRNDYAARSLINLDYDPIKERSYGSSNSNNLNINVTANAELKIWKGLSFIGTYGYVRGPGTSENYSDAKTLLQRRQLLSFTKAPYIGATPEYLLPTDGGTYTVTTYDQRNWTVRNQLAYNASPRHGKDVLSLQAGEEAAQDQRVGSNNTLYGYKKALGTYAVLDYKTLSQGVFGTVTGYGYFNGQPFNVTNILSRYYSWFALGSYTFDSKYSLDLSWRRDHSNLFGSDVSAQNKPIYSFGGKWQLAREEFMKKISWLNDLALRATYGITGNSPYVGAASISDILEANPAAYSGGVAGDALDILNAANRKVSWESTHTLNLAVDFGVLNRRITGSIEVYNKRTTDLLYNLPVNQLNGFTSSLGNLGELRNKGIELTIHSDNLHTGDFSWSTNFNFSHNKNKLVSLGDGVVQDYMNTPSYIMSALYVIGQPLQPLYAYRFAGLDNMGDPQIKLGDGKTITKDPFIATKNDLVFKGTTIPPYYGGLNNTFQYKGLSLAVNMVYNLGHVMRPDVNQFYAGRLGGNTASFGGQNIAPSFLNRWKQPGDEKKTDIPSFVADYSSYSRRNVDYYTKGDINVVSASYVKIRDFTLGYDLSPSVLRTLKVKRVNVYGQVTNFMVWKANHDGIDPEYMSLSSGYRDLPPFKHSYSLGLNVTL